MIDLKLPEKSGQYSVTFRLVHGDHIEFGDEVTVNLDVQPKQPEIACNTGVSSNLASSATHEQQLNETSACSIPVDEEDNSDDSCQSENEMNVSITSWDMVGDYGEAMKDGCHLGSIPGIEDEKLGDGPVAPHKFEAIHSLKEKQACPCCDQDCCLKKDSGKLCCEKTCCQQMQRDEESDEEEEEETVLTVIATGCADFTRDVWAIWKGQTTLPSFESDSKLMVTD